MYVEAFPQLLLRICYFALKKLLSRVFLLKDIFPWKMKFIVLKSITNKVLASRYSWLCYRIEKENGYPLGQAHSTNVELLLVILSFFFFGCDIVFVGSISPQSCSCLSRWCLPSSLNGFSIWSLFSLWLCCWKCGSFVFLIGTKGSILNIIKKKRWSKESSLRWCAPIG